MRLNVVAYSSVAILRNKKKLSILIKRLWWRWSYLFINNASFFFSLSFSNTSSQFGRWIQNFHLPQIKACVTRVGWAPSNQELRRRREGPLHIPDRLFRDYCLETEVRVFPRRQAEFPKWGAAKHRHVARVRESRVSDGLFVFSTFNLVLFHCYPPTLENVYQDRGNWFASLLLDNWSITECWFDACTTALWLQPASI